jgi:hypothetical protein
VEGRPTYPPTSRWSASAGDTPCAPGLGTCIAGVVSYARRGWIEPARPHDWLRGRGRRSLVPEERVELSRGCPRGILSPLRLPFRHSGVIAGPQLSAGADPVEGALYRASAKRSPCAGYAACGLRLLPARIARRPQTHSATLVRRPAGIYATSTPGLAWGLSCKADGVEESDDHARYELGGGLVASFAVTASERWSWGARRLGMASSIAILIVGILYVTVITLWLIVEATPREPIGDPYLAVMEILTMVSALALGGLVIAIWCFAGVAHRLPALTTLAIGALAAGLTMAVHFLQLTAIRQLWRAGSLVDYRLVWPSALFALEYFAWDILVGFTLLSMSFAIAGGPGAEPARRALLIGGVLCLAGVAGPLSGRMVLQNVAVLGYAVALPVAGALTARMFRAALPASSAA